MMSLPSADFIYLMGNIYKANKMYDQALAQYKKAIGMPQCKLNGANSFLPLYQSGTIFEITGHIPDAIACYKHCGNLAPALQRLDALLHKQS